MHRFPHLTRSSRSRRISAGSQLHVEALEDRRMLAVLTVNSIADDTAAGDGLVTLREAIIAANTDTVTDLGHMGSGADAIAFDSALSGRTIEIDSELLITDDLTIDGPGAEQLTIDAGNGADNTFATGDGYRIFDINDGDDNNEIDVTLSGLTLTGGDTANGIDDGSSPTKAEDGGAIRTAENLTILDSKITGNATGRGGNATSCGGWHCRNQCSIGH